MFTALYEKHVLIVQMDRWKIIHICIYNVYIYSSIPILFFREFLNCWLLNVTHWLELRNFSCYYQRIRLIFYILAQTQTNTHTNIHLHTNTRTHSHTQSTQHLLFCCTEMSKVAIFHMHSFCVWQGLTFSYFMLFFRNNVDGDGKSVKPARQFSLSYCFLIICFSASYFHICRQKQSCALVVVSVVVIAASALLFLHTHLHTFTHVRTHTQARIQAQLAILLAFS